MPEYRFPGGLYTDVRIEEVYQTSLTYMMEVLEESRSRHYQAAFIRIFDGSRWYYSATSEVTEVQKEIDELARLAHPCAGIEKHPVVQKLEANRGEHFQFDRDSVTDIPRQDKEKLLTRFFGVLKRPSVNMFRPCYMDERKIKRFYSSKGANLAFDTQLTGFRIFLGMSAGEKKLQESYGKAGVRFHELDGSVEALAQYLDKCETFLQQAEAITPGKYTVILSPTAAGVFAHESFGHKSEADFMVGDETMKKEWAIGTRVGPDMLSIVDDGNELARGYAPFDEEGTRARRTYLVRDGLLAGRLHSAATAADLEEEVTGNCRAVSFEYEPIVRMTSTFILPGDKTFEQLVGEVEDGVFVDTVRHGSGMSTFTIAPGRCYRIRKGRIAEPVHVSVITGSVFETLGKIDGLSDKLEIISSIGGGCGKMEQIGLHVSFGGPYVRVRSMNLQ